MPTTSSDAIRCSILWIVLRTVKVHGDARGCALTAASEVAGGRRRPSHARAAARCLQWSLPGPGAYRCAALRARNPAGTRCSARRATRAVEPTFSLSWPARRCAALPLRHIRRVHLPGGGSHLWEQWPLMRYARGAYLVNFNYSGPLLKRWQLVTVHDATVRVMPAVLFTCLPLVAQHPGRRARPQRPHCDDGVRIFARRTAALVWPAPQGHPGRPRGR